MQPTEANQDLPLSEYVFFLAANSSNPEHSADAQVFIWAEYNDNSFST